MSFGVYFHIPYCLQRCHYCDFATYEIDSILEPSKYIELLKKEMKLRHTSIPFKSIDSIYFGGGTPSLLEPKYIVSLIRELANLGFNFKPNIEITMEINPGTTFNANLEHYVMGGVNRYSVGAQSFSDEHLDNCGRKHKASDTCQTLDLLSKNNLNFSLDILFALPNQTLTELTYDVDKALSFKPKHISAYCLTVPGTHKMAANRPVDQVQVDMFNLIENKLNNSNLKKYEISNFSLPKYESTHNMIYWTDQPYWGIGLSAHSYFPCNNLRFWNPKSIGEYNSLISDTDDSLFELKNINKHLNKNNYEFLQVHEVMTDFCHIHLRTLSGLHKEALRKRFAPKQNTLISHRLFDLEEQGLINQSEEAWFLSKQGLLVSNLVFDRLYFSSSDLSAWG